MKTYGHYYMLDMQSYSSRSQRDTGSILLHRVQHAQLDSKLALRVGNNGIGELATQLVEGLHMSGGHLGANLDVLDPAEVRCNIVARKTKHLKQR